MLCMAAIPTTLNLNQFNSTAPLSIKSGILVTNPVFSGNVTASKGGYLTGSISVAGEDYTIGNTLTAQGGNGDFIITVTSIDGFGGVTGFDVVSIGSGYSTGVKAFTGGGGGTGASINITAIQPVITVGGDVSATNFVSKGSVTLGGEARTTWPSGGGIDTSNGFGTNTTLSSATYEIKVGANIYDVLDTYSSTHFDLLDVVTISEVGGGQNFIFFGKNKDGDYGLGLVDNANGTNMDIFITAIGGNIQTAGGIVAQQGIGSSEGGVSANSALTGGSISISGSFTGTVPNTIGSGLAITSGAFEVTSPTTPASATATGTVGTIAWDSDYIYICVATDTWKRVAISTWP